MMSGNKNAAGTNLTRVNQSMPRNKNERNQINNEDYTSLFVLAVVEYLRLRRRR
jgi:hypothetical protein